MVTPTAPSSLAPTTLSEKFWTTGRFTHLLLAIRSLAGQVGTEPQSLAEKATPGGDSGGDVRDVMLAAVEQRFGTMQAGAPIEWLSDNGSAYIDHRTRSFARELVLEPLTKPVRSSRSNGMAESFVKTVKHGSIAFMPKSDVPTARSHLAGAFEHYNERHPNKAWKYRPPREFRRTTAAST